MRHFLLGIIIVLANATQVAAMDFKTQYNGGNCGECSWILAEGPIEPGTTEKLKKFISKEKPPPNILFNSPGGNLVEALKLGRFLRENHFDTFVGETSAIIPGHFPEYAPQKSTCYSACVYAFVGGVHRTAKDKSLGIHQFYRPDDALRPNDTTLSAVDMSNMQRLLSVLAEYVHEMGVDTRLVTMASTITPWQPIYVLSERELTILNLDNSQPPAQQAGGNWSVRPAGNGAMAVTTQVQDGAGRVAILALSCATRVPNIVFASILLQDKNQPWTEAFEKLQFKVQDITFNIDGQYTSLEAARLVDPIERHGDGVTFKLALTKAELQRMILARTVELSAFVDMVTIRFVGDLGGTFSMAGAADTISLALRNCPN